MWVFRRRRALLRVDRKRWHALVAELGRRGHGRGESGAFLLAHKTDRRPQVAEVVYYDDLDPHCLDGGDISLGGFAYSKLWDICSANGLRLIGDVHTHPTADVNQSRTDRDHPMHAQPGHVALILPDFATHAVAADAVGVHEYLGDTGWRSSMGDDARRHLLHLEMGMTSDGDALHRTLKLELDSGRAANEDDARRIASQYILQIVAGTASPGVRPGRPRS